MAIFAEYESSATWRYKPHCVVPGNVAASVPSCQHSTEPVPLHFEHETFSRNISYMQILVSIRPSVSAGLRINSTFAKCIVPGVFGYFGTFLSFFSAILLGDLKA